MNATVTGTLQVSDRCDRCGAQAYVKVVLPTGGILFFCGHHYTANKAQIQQQAAEIVDETRFIS
ncbi:MAG: DUF7455 domain-containing protein [Candidatus Nanopelagicales bacterium]